AVVLDVAGEHVTEMGVSGVRLQQQGEQGATFEVTVHNSGNVYTKGEGFVLIKDQNGADLASIPWTMDTVLPRDTAGFLITHPVHLADGDYRLTVLLTYEGKSAVLEDVEIQVRNGQPQVEAAPGGSVLAPAITLIGSPGEPGILSGLSGWGRGLAIAGIALLVVGLAAVEVVIWRKIRRGRGAQN
ncbi:MAG TPA: hypothetical protein VFF68_07100, partial [Anaerolineaceae bacterium]|nr:hypothetical protein [Anaerolineaceae bacterium]